MNKSFLLSSYAMPALLRHFLLSASGDVALEDVRIQFVNDLFDAANGIDRNVQIFEFRVIDSQNGEVSTASTTDADVLSTGIFVPGEGITFGFGAGGFLAGNGSVQQVSTGTGVTASIDSSFQVTDFSSGQTAVGPNNQVASVAFFGGDLILVDDAGIPISTFGDNGFVNVPELLGDRLGSLDPPRLSYDDLEFFDDGSILVTGDLFRPITTNVVRLDPLIVKLNADGSLDESFSQQGILQGTFLQFFGINSITKSVVDNVGRIYIFGDNAFGTTNANYIVSRLNADGTLDATFGNGGNVFIANSELGLTDSAGGNSSNAIDVEVTSNNQVVFGIGGPISDLVIVGKLNEDGSRDSTFGNNGLASVSIDSPDEFALDSQDRIVVGGGEFFPLLTRLTANGQIDNSFGVNGSIELIPDDSIGSQGISIDPETGGPFSTFRLFIDGFAINSADNITATGSAFGFATDGSSPLVLQRVTADGQVDQSFGIGGSSVIQESEQFQGNVTRLIFDSADRLVLSGSDIIRVEFV